MSSKSFTTYAPTEKHNFDINGTIFRLVPDVPGAVLLDFLATADADNNAAMASVLNSLFEAAIVQEDRDKFFSFIRDPENHVNLETLAEVAGYIAEKLSGAGKADPSPANWPLDG